MLEIKFCQTSKPKVIDVEENNKMGLGFGSLESKD